jgi:small subunit ribosomal protein S4e
MTHLKRLRMPKTWPLTRKGEKFVVTPSPGPHAKMECMPLRVILRDLLGFASNAKETREILSKGNLLVDKKPRASSRFPIGIMDVIEIPDAKKHFRMIITSSGLDIHEIPESEATKKLCKIEGKTTLKKGLQQLNLHDGRNILVKKDAYKVGDSITISIPDQKILKHHRLEKGAYCLITSGRNIGTQGRIKEIEEKQHMLEKSTVTIDTPKGDIKTLRGYVFITDRLAAKPSETKHKKPGRKK